MPNRADKLLRDILIAGERASAFVSDKSLTDLETDIVLRSAVERQLEIVGEAVRQLHKVDPALTDRITDARRIIDFRNVLAHGYDSISEDIIWQVLVDKLPALLAETRILLTPHSPP